jgi:hypothetical protein
VGPNGLYPSLFQLKKSTSVIGCVHCINGANLCSGNNDIGSNTEVVLNSFDGKFLLNRVDICDKKRHLPNLHKLTHITHIPY